MKIVGTFLVVLIAGLALLGIFSNFVANEELLSYFIWGGFGFSLVLVVLILAKLLKEGSAYTERMRDQGKSPLVGVLAIVIMVPGMTVVAAYNGLPVALNYIFGSQGELERTVQSKPPGYHSRRCPGRVNLQEYSYFTNERVCGIQEADWRLLTSGSKIILVGNRSMFGIHYDQYKIL